MSKTLWAALGFASLGLYAAETRISFNDLPAAAQNAVKEQTRNAKIRGFSKEVENGTTFYEVETTTADGRTRDLLIDAAGKVAEVEQEVTLDSLTPPVQRAFKTAAGSGKITKIETVTRGPVVSYEAVVLKDGQKTEVGVNPDGTLRKQ